MDPKLKFMLSAVFGFFGVLALWTGGITMSSPEGLGPDRRISGLAARVVGALLLASAVAFFHPVGVGLALFLLAVAAATAAVRSRGQGSE